MSRRTPVAVIGGATQRAYSDILWRPPFDNTESRLGGRERHIVGHDRLGEALEGERANLFGGDASLQRDIDALTEQNLTVFGLSAKTGGDIAHGADRGVARAFGEPDLAQRRIALCDTGAKAQITTTLTPVGDQRASPRNGFS